MSRNLPQLVILAGPNGAGKSTTAPYLLKGALGVTEFVNADTIAQGLSAFEPEKAAIQAGRAMLQRLDFLAGKKIDFAFESTLASRTHAIRVKRWKASLGYRSHLVFLWLKSPDLAVQRVAERVRLGGHHIPEETIRRRYTAGLHNFFSIYRSLMESWHFYDNSGPEYPRLIARGKENTDIIVHDLKLWKYIQEYHNEKKSSRKKTY